MSSMQPGCRMGNSDFLSVRNRRGQIISEYFILFALIAALTLVGVTHFDQNVRNILEDFFEAAANVLAN